MTSPFVTRSNRLSLWIDEIGLLSCWRGIVVKDEERTKWHYLEGCLNVVGRWSRTALTRNNFHGAPSLAGVFQHLHMWEPRLGCYVDM
jgi:hypothetical protein